MSAPAKWALLAALSLAPWVHEARADRQTVCPITVNSPDEREKMSPELVRNLRQHRLKGADRDDVIDALIRRV